MSGLRQNQGDEDLIADTPNALITYRGEIPPEIQAALEPLLEKYKCLIPAWCHRINVSYWSSPPGGSQYAAADVTVNYDYRSADIRIFPSLTFSLDDRRGEFIAHEMMHVSVNPIADYCLAAIRRLFEMDVLKDADGSKGFKAMKDMIIEELKNRNESVTTDLQKIVCGLMDTIQRESLPASAVVVRASG